MNRLVERSVLCNAPHALPGAPHHLVYFHDVTGELRAVAADYAAARGAAGSTREVML